LATMLRATMSLRGAARLPGLRAGVRAMSDYKGVAHPFNPNVGEPKTLQREPYMHADMVLEEEKTGFPAGLPFKRDREIWANPNDPNQLIAERAEMWWDDGTAEPEWFVDRGSAGGADGGRPWAQSTKEAAMQLGVMFGFLGCVMGGAMLVGDKLRWKFAGPGPWVHSYPVDMHKQFGLERLPKDGSPLMQGTKRTQQYGVEEEEEEE